MKNKGWYNDRPEHSLASRGIKTKYDKKTPVRTISQPHYDYKTRRHNGATLIKVMDGRNVVGSMNIIDHTDESNIRQVGADEPHLYIGLIEIRDQYQNQGIGSELINKAIQEQEQRDLPLYLTASPTEGWKADPSEHSYKTEKLVEFYQRKGFHVKSVDDGLIRMVRYP